MFILALNLSLLSF